MRQGRDADNLRECERMVNYDDEEVKQVVLEIEEAIIQAIEGLEQAGDGAQAIRLDNIRKRLEDNLLRIKQYG